MTTQLLYTSFLQSATCDTQVWHSGALPAQVMFAGTCVLEMHVWQAALYMPLLSGMQMALPPPSTDCGHCRLKQVCTAASFITADIVAFARQAVTHAPVVHARSHILSCEQS